MYIVHIIEKACIDYVVLLHLCYIFNIKMRTFSILIYVCAFLYQCYIPFSNFEFTVVSVNTMYE